MNLGFEFVRPEADPEFLHLETLRLKARLASGWSPHAVIFSRLKAYIVLKGFVVMKASAICITSIFRGSIVRKNYSKIKAAIRTLGYFFAFCIRTRVDRVIRLARENRVLKRMFAPISSDGGVRPLHSDEVFKTLIPLMSMNIETYETHDCLSHYKYALDGNRLTFVAQE